MESEIGRLERERRQAQGELQRRWSASSARGWARCAKEAGNLVSALKRPPTRGSWGEIQLRNVVEMAGMVSHCDFLEQTTIQTDDGAICDPDMLVRLPGEKLVVVDSKVPLDAYLSSLEASGEEEREVHAGRHARQTREHIAKLASKGYQRQFDSTPEFVVMFVPSDGIYQAALAQDPCADRIRRPAAGPDGDADNADRAAVGGPLRLAPGADRGVRARDRRVRARAAPAASGRFVEPLAKVGRQLDSAVSAYNEAVGSFDARVIPQVRRIEQAGAASEREVEARRRDRDHRRAIAAQPELAARGARGAGPSLLSARPRRALRRRRVSTISDQRQHATGTVAGSSLTKKNSRSNTRARQSRPAGRRRSCSERPTLGSQQTAEARRR
jgi:DNA recombination protein RmuC